jgi:hypothetical protein
MTEVERFIKLKKKIETLSQEKIRFEERYENERKKLETLISEIKNKGYNPTKLAEIKNSKEKELKETLDKLEKKVTDIDKKLKEIEGSND